MSISGKFLTAKLGSVPAVIVGNYAWTAEEQVDELDGTTGADNGFDNPDAGCQSLRITLRGYMDVTAGQYIPIRAGTVLTSLKLFRVAADTNPAFTVTSALVLRSTQSAEVKGRVEWQAEIKSKGNVITVQDPA